MSYTRQIMNLFLPSEKKEAFKILILCVLVSLIEIGGIASIMPFVAVLSSPEMVETNRYLNMAYAYFDFENTRQFLFFLGFIVLALLLISNALKAYTSWKKLNFSVMTGHSISMRLFEHYLYKPYVFFLDKKSSDLISMSLSEVSRIVTQVVMPAINIIATAINAIAILMLLLFVNPKLSLITGVVLGSAFFLVYIFMRNWLYRLGKDRITAQATRFGAANEAFVNIKNVKLTANEPAYVHQLNPASYRFAHTSALSTLAGDLPRYALEVIAFGGVLLMILFLLNQDDSFAQTLPILSLYAFAGYRLMPAFMSIFNSFTKMRFQAALLDKIADQTAHLPQIQNKAAGEKPAPLPFNEKISFRDIDFGYSAGQPIIENLNFDIQKNTIVGVVGKTGSGKTTIVDMLVGLLAPTGGEVRIDSVLLDRDNRRRWQQQCAYVTQQINLTDNTVKGNIAFGIPYEDIDDEKVRSAAEMAAVAEFVEHLPEGYDTHVGENGVRFSGGQKQRIALARALYLDRPVLILDEATSALDTETEGGILKALLDMDQDKTIIIITHRKETLENVDQIIDLDKHVSSS